MFVSCSRYWAWGLLSNTNSHSALTTSNFSRSGESVLNEVKRSATDCFIIYRWRSCVGHISSMAKTQKSFRRVEMREYGDIYHLSLLNKNFLSIFSDCRKTKRCNNMKSRHRSKKAKNVPDQNVRLRSYIARTITEEFEDRWGFFGHNKIFFAFDQHNWS